MSSSVRPCGTAYTVADATGLPFWSTTVPLISAEDALPGDWADRVPLTTIRTRSGFTGSSEREFRDLDAERDGIGFALVQKFVSDRRSVHVPERAGPGAAGITARSAGAGCFW